ncbi:MAG: PD-(D/E)XK nuclease family protein, partial [Pirellulales bacterium]
FGPDKIWSSRSLESYAYCPFRFFLEDVLRVEPLDDLAVADDGRSRGEALHGALAAAHRAALAAHGKPLTPSAAGDAFTTGFKQHLQALVESLQSHSGFDRTLRDIDLEMIGELLSLYVAQHETYEAEMGGAPLLPAHFEVSFGLPEQYGAVLDSLSKVEPLAMGEGEDRVLLRGQIDRIDVGRVGDRSFYSIVDYKSSRPAGPKAATPGVVDRMRLQLDLYAWAAELLLAHDGAAPWQTGYWFVRVGGGHKSWRPLCAVEDGVVVDKQNWREAKDALVRRVQSLVRAVRGGQFPMASAEEDCTGRCPYGTVCRVNESRALDRIWLDGPFAEETTGDGADSLPLALGESRREGESP